VSKKESSKLFELIKSLDKGERRNFKLFSTEWKGNTANNHHKLFDIIDGQKHYDEQSIRKKYPHEKFVKNLATTKVHLYNSILKSFSYYNTGAALQGDLWKKIIAAEVLLNKRLYDHCQQQINKIKKEAYKVEEFALLLDVVRVEERLIRSGVLKIVYSKLKELFKEEQNLIELIYNINTYKTINRDLFDSIWKYGAHNKEALANELKTIMAHPEMKDISMALSIKAKAIFLHMHGACGFALEKLSHSVNYTKKRLELMEAHPHILIRTHAEHQGVLSNLVSIYYEQRKFSEAIAIIAKYETAYGENLKIHTTKMQIYLALGEMDRFRSLMINAEKILKKNSNDNYYIQFIGIIIVSYFAEGSYKKAQQWNNRLLNRNDTSFSLDLFLFVRLFAMLIAFELKEYHLLESYTRSLKRQLNKLGGARSVASLLVDFIQKAQFQKLDDSYYNMLRDLKSNLDKLKKEAGGHMMEYFNLSIWVQSKIEKKTFIQVLKKENKKKLIDPLIS